VIGYFIQERFIFVPSFRLEPPQLDLASPHEELFFDAPHQGRIHGLLLFHENPKGIIFYLHGNTGNLGRWKYMAEEISRYGYNVLAIDYRGYGKSKGKRSEKIMHDDCFFCCRQIHQRFSDLPLIVYGRSLGTGFATQLAVNHGAHKLILETPFKNLLDVAASYFPFLPMKLLLKYGFRSDLFLPKITCPVLILHGTKDRIVPYRSAIELYNCASPKQNVKMITIPGGRHNNLNAFPLFVDSLRSFLSE
jgi:hypothetical protein